MKTKLMVCVLAFALLLCGCAGYRETDSEYLISSVAFKKQDGIFYAYIEVLALSAKESNSYSKVFMSQGKTPFEAVNNTVAMLSKKAVFDHCAVAIIEDSIKGNDLKEINKYLYNTRNLNLGIYVFVTEDAQKILSLKSEAIGIGYDLMNIELNIDDTSGIKCKNKFYEIESGIDKTDTFILPRVSEDSDRPVIIGYDVYKNYSPAVKLSEDEGLFLNLLLGGSNGGEISVSGKRCRIDLISSNISKSGKNVFIDMKIRYKYKDENQDKKIAREIKKITDKLQNANAISVLGFKNAKTVKKTEVSSNVSY